GGADRVGPGQGVRACCLQPRCGRDGARDPRHDRGPARAPPDTGMTENRLQGRRVVVGISGGIAAYKAIEVIRLLTEAGAEVRVMMTPEATRFVTPLTLEALSNHPVAADWLNAQGAGESHIALAEWGELIAIVPATANGLAKLALGIADEIVSGTVLASRAPLLVAPAMNDLMFTHVKTQDHLNALRSRHAVVVEPGVGRLASGKSAVGRLAAPERTLPAIEPALHVRRNLL